MERTSYRSKVVIYSNANWHPPTSSANNCKLKSSWKEKCRADTKQAFDDQKCTTSFCIAGINNGVKPKTKAIDKQADASKYEKQCARLAKLLDGFIGTTRICAMHHPNLIRLS